MIPIRVASRSVGRHYPRPARFSTATRYCQKDGNTVQTPLQSQNKGSIAPSAARPAGDAQLIDTPLGKQRRDAIIPQPTSKADRERSRPVMGLMAGLVGIPPLVYYYYEYRREHMDRKRANLVEQQRQKYASGG